MNDDNNDDADNSTCQGRAASGGHEQQDADQFVLNWGARYVKYCVCNTTHDWRLVAYNIFSDALNATGSPVRSPDSLDRDCRILQCQPQG